MFSVKDISRPQFPDGIGQVEEATSERKSQICSCHWFTDTWRGEEGRARLIVFRTSLQKSRGFLQDQDGHLRTYVRADRAAGDTTGPAAWFTNRNPYSDTSRRGRRNVVETLSHAVWGEFAVSKDDMEIWRRRKTVALRDR